MGINLSFIGTVVVFASVFLWRFAEDPLTFGFEGPPDTVFVNAVFWTADTNKPIVEAIAVRNGRIVQTGTKLQIQALAGKQTERVNLGGAFVTPGFMDSHVHFLYGGLQLTRLDLRGCMSAEDVAASVAEAIKAVKERGAWILGWGWNEWNWGGEEPTAAWLDRMAPENPVWLSRIDGHMGLANSVALALARINASTRDPEGGTVVRTPQGKPSGLLKDTAMALLQSVVPPPSLEQRRQALEHAMDHALAHGVTAVADFGNYVPGSSPGLAWDDLQDVYDWADASGKLRLRVNAVTPLVSWERTLARVAERGKRASQWLRWGCLKEFADGSLGSHTALFHQPYADSPSDNGLEVVDRAYLAEAVDSAVAAGLQVAVHAIGDKAVDNVLDIYAHVTAKFSDQDLRLRVEHVQHLSPAAAQRAGALRVVSSVQPQHLLDDVKFLEASLGKERMMRAYLFGSLRRNGSVLALGSDWTVAPLDPLGGMLAAVTRKPPGWKTPFNVKEALDGTEALLGYTKTAAHASFWDDEIGSLSIGKLADFVVLSRNPIEALDSYAPLPKIMRTYVGGKLAYPEQLTGISGS